MPSASQLFGRQGERLIAKRYRCPKCKKPFTLRALPPNFKCADLICDFCGYLAQVKTATVSDTEVPPSRILGATWGPQKARIDAGIYFPLFLVVRAGRKTGVYYLPVDYQHRSMFVPRSPLPSRARRASWRGFYYDLSRLPEGALAKVIADVRAGKRLQRSRRK